MICFCRAARLANAVGFVSPIIFNGEHGRAIVKILAGSFAQPPAIKNTLKFPAHFLWGAATAPTQIEGHVTNEWTDFVARDGGSCRIACDSYHRYPEDIEWLVKLGVKAYRFGIEWSRLQAAPFAPLNQNELARYCDQLDRLQAAGILPMVVLHHFSNPPWIGAAGGLASMPPRWMPLWITSRNLATALRSLGARLEYISTNRTPYASCTYLLGEFPPGFKRQPLAFRRVILNMAAAHVKVCKIIRRQGSEIGPVEVGFTKNWTTFQSYYPASPWDSAIAAASHAMFNRFVLHAFLDGQRREAPTFLGLNYYGRVRFRHSAHAGVRRWAVLPASIWRKSVLFATTCLKRHPPGMEITPAAPFASTVSPFRFTSRNTAPLRQMKIFAPMI